MYPRTCHNALFKCKWTLICHITYYILYYIFSLINKEKSYNSGISNNNILAYLWVGTYGHLVSKTPLPEATQEFLASVVMLNELEMFLRFQINPENAPINH